MGKPAFRVLVVCTGNICRSPVAERLLAAGLRERFGTAADAVDVRSAGTWAHVGAPMQPFAAEVLAELGGAPDGFVARELVAAQVAAADLVLGVTRDHRAAAVRLAPRAAARAFTLRELARLAGQVDPGELPAGGPAERLAALVAAAAARRGLLPPERPEDDDVADPYRRPLAEFRRAGAEIAAAVRALLDVLAPRAREGTPVQ